MKHCRAVDVSKKGAGKLPETSGDPRRIPIHKNPERLQNDTLGNLRRIQRYNVQIGLPERRRGLHYWLGFEYALAMTQLEFAPRPRILDVGTGGYSIWPYLLAHYLDAVVVATDLDSALHRQKAMRDRAVRAGLCRSEQVRYVRTDARQLPFADNTFDGFTAMSSIEHVQNMTGDRQALREAARTLRPGSHAIVTVPFRASGSLAEMDDHLQLYQRHYSEQTLTTSLLEPSGLRETGRVFYGERLALYRTLRNLPLLLRVLVRPWNAALSAQGMRVCPEPDDAAAVLIKLAKQG